MLHGQRVLIQNNIFKIQILNRDNLCRKIIMRGKISAMLIEPKCRWTNVQRHKLTYSRCYSTALMIW